MRPMIEKRAMLSLIIDAKRSDPKTGSFAEWLAEYLAEYLVEHIPVVLQPNAEQRSPYTDGDTSIIACSRCGSGEYLHNEDGNEMNYCGQCGQRIDWSRSTEGTVC